MKDISRIFPDKYFDKNNIFYKAWSKKENKNKLPIYLNKVVEIDYSEFYKKVYKMNELEATQLVNSLLNGDVYLLKNFYSKNDCNSLIDKVYDIFQTTPEEFHKIKNGIPDYHRYISVELSKKYSIKLVKQTYYIFPWNDHKLKLFNNILPVWRMLKYISGYHSDAWEKNLPIDGVVDRIQVARYPPRDGQAELHQDPYVFQKFVISIYLSKKDHDYEGGGFYALTEEKNKVFIDNQVDKGDLFFGFATIKHGVEPCDVNISPDKSKKDGRWWIGLYSVETDYVSNRRTAKPIK